MFTDEKNSLFENNDEFGVQNYREDINILARMNSIKVKLHKFNENTISEGEFGGTSDKNHDNKFSLIDININSSNSENNKLDEEGFTGRGEIRFSCFVEYNIKISNKDIVEFLSEFSYGIKPGDKFRVEMEDNGAWEGQYTRQNFSIVKL